MRQIEPNQFFFSSQSVNPTCMSRLYIPVSLSEQSHPIHPQCGAIKVQLLSADVSDNLRIHKGRNHLTRLFPYNP